MYARSIDALFVAAAHRPLLQSLAIVLGTFILEDVTTVLTAMRAEGGMIPIPYAIGALYTGIVLGDLGLYGMGRLSAGTGWFKRLLPDHHILSARQWLDGRLGMAVLTSRFLPGMRLPTYTACGYLAVPFGEFALAAIAATLIWTSLLFIISMSFGVLILDHFGQWRWAGGIGFALGIFVLGRLAGRLYRERQ